MSRIIVVFSVILLSFSLLKADKKTTIGPSDCDIDFTVPDDFHICEGGDIEICATIDSDYDEFVWEVDGQETFHDLCDEFEIEEETELKLIVTYVNPDNLIENGDFEDGDSGFTTDYISGPGNCLHVAGFLTCEGYYHVMDDPSDGLSNFASCGDIVGGSNMMVVNGNVGDINIWCQDVCINPDGIYKFTAWATSVFPDSPAELQFSIDGDLIGNIFEVSSSVCNWEQFEAEWEAEGSSNVEICITNQNTTAWGNDFALDGIELLEVCVEEKEFTITVSDLELSASIPDSIDCTNTIVDIMLDIDNSNTDDIVWETLDGVIENILDDGELIMVSSAGTYSVTVTDDENCEYIENVVVIADSQIPTAAISPNGTLACSNPTITLAATTNAGSPSYSWADEFGNPLGNADNINVTAGGQYFLTIMDALSGCMNSANIEVLADTLTPFFDLEVSNNLDCNFQSATIRTDSSFVAVQWSSTNLTPILESADSLIVTTPGTYFAEVVNANGCSHIDSIEVLEVNPNFDYTLDGNEFINCSNPIAFISVALDENLFDVSWRGLDTIIGNVTSIELDESGTYFLEITDASGCSTEESFVIEENFNIPDVTPTATTIGCMQPESTISIEDPQDIFIVEWEHENGMTFFDEDVITSLTPGTLYYTVTAPNGCQKMDSLEITASLDFPEVTISGGALNCNTTEISLTAISNDNLISYNWMLPDGTSTSGIEIEVSEAGTYSLVVENDQACEATAEFVVAIDTTPPSLEPIADLLLGCDQNTLPVSINVFSTFETLLWTGPNFTSDQMDVEISEPGEYEVAVTGTNGCQAIESFVVSLDTDLPIVDISDPELLTCDLQNFAPIIELPIDYISFEWSFPDGTTTDDPDINITQAGLHNIEVVGANGCSTNIEYLVEEAIDLPSFNLAATVIDCNNPNSTITATSTTNDLMFEYFQEGNSIGSGVSIEVENNGEVLVVATDINGCSVEEIITAQIDTVTIQFEATAKILDCINTSTPVVINIQDFESAQVLDENGVFISQFNNAFESEEISESGLYQIEVFANNGCVSNQWIEIIEDKEIVDFTLSSTPITCIEETAIISVDNSSNFNGGSVIHQASTESFNLSNEITVDLPGIYEVTLIGENGCENTIETEVVANVDNPESSSFELEVIGCNESALLSDINIVGGTAPYDIYVDNVIVDTTIDSYSLASLGQHDLQIIDTNGCSLDTSFSVSMIEIISADIIPEVTIESGEELQLFLNTNKPASEIETIEWFPQTALSCYDCSEPFFTGQDSTDYTITVADNNGCETMVELRVNVNALETPEIPGIYIPNVIAPSLGNEDNSFTLYTSQGQINQINHLQVYDRWGNVMFINEDFQPNIPSEGWNGLFNDQAVQPGVYVYLIEVLYLDGSTEMFADQVTVLR